MSSKKIPPKVQQYLKQMDDLQKTYASIITQKQQLQLSYAEYKNALEALKKAPEDTDVYKLVGNIFFKANKDSLEEELNENIELLQARIKALETQENKIVEELNKLKSEVTKMLSGSPSL
jgi:prefoldin beta subunit